MNTGYENLSTFDRVSRMLLGYVLIGVAYSHQGFLGLLALLPLIAIYPMMTASIGFCPIEGAIQKFWSGVKAQPKVAAVQHRSGQLRQV